MKKSKNTFRNFLTKAAAGVAVGIAAMMLIKSEKQHVQKQKMAEKESSQERLFI